jgi:hypothetical protein
MMNPFGSELAHERGCDRMGYAVPRREGPGPIRITIGRVLIGAGARLTHTTPQRVSLPRRAS